MNDRVITLTLTEPQFVLVQRALRAHSPEAGKLRDELGAIARLALPDIPEVDALAARDNRERQFIALIQSIQFRAAAHRADALAFQAQAEEARLAGQEAWARRHEDQSDAALACAKLEDAAYRAAVLEGPAGA